MWTVMWVEDGMDKWDRFETENDVRNLMEELKENSDVCEEDVWIFPPKADDYVITGDIFIEMKM